MNTMADANNVPLIFPRAALRCDSLGFRTPAPMHDTKEKEERVMVSNGKQNT